MTVDAAQPSTRRRERTRARLLDAAHEVFGEVGMTAASVELITERAGFTRGAFYSNFESKEELLLALIARLSEAKIDEVAGRVRTLEPGAKIDPAAVVRQLVGGSMTGLMEPQLVSEIRTQALRDSRLAAAYLDWQRGLHSRVEQIVRGVADLHGLALRLSAAEAAQLILDITDETCVRAALEGRTQDEIDDLLHRRLEVVVALLVDEN